VISEVNMAEPNMPTIDQMLCFAVYATGHAFTRFYKPRLDALELTYPQYLVFLVLWEQDDVTVKALGERLFLDSGTITPLIKRLEARGLVTRQRDEDDERQVRIRLTKEGRALKAKAFSIPLAVIEGTGLTQDGAETMREELLALRVRLDAALDTPGK
jgi:DNA-binding MarR family transcriptional regulator